MAPVALDPPRPPLGHLTHPHPHPRDPHHPIPARGPFVTLKFTAALWRQKIMSLVLLLVGGGSTGRWSGLPRREEGGRRTPGPELHHPDT